MTKVFVLQRDENKRHNHSYKDFSEDSASGGFWITIANIVNHLSFSGVFSIGGSAPLPFVDGGNINNTTYQVNFSHSHTHSFTINDSGIDESRSLNETFRIWKRID